MEMRLFSRTVEELEQNACLQCCGIKQAHSQGPRRESIIGAMPKNAAYSKALSTALWKNRLVTLFVCEICGAGKNAIALLKNLTARKCVPNAARLSNA